MNTIAEWVNSLTSEQYLRLLDICDPNPPTPEEWEEINAMTDDELLKALLED